MTNQEKLATYKIEVSPLAKEDGDGYQAFYPVLARTTVGYGETPQVALQELLDSNEALLEALGEMGQTLP